MDEACLCRGFLINVAFVLSISHPFLVLRDLSPVLLKLEAYGCQQKWLWTHLDNKNVDASLLISF